MAQTLSTSDVAAARQVPCPACGGPSLYSPANPSRPFCSERCRKIDLGAWANDEFRMPDNEPADPGASDQTS
ncbi:DNA gyrase inhibitor YacG [Pulveribacter suum]|uniref:DNA gyrase inhibitor YacG n=1 Tax=Pulveribacter suum TaxID=2116657 RepID=A0A2P1NNM3_9BURK|nr:DNA gyrase inhibitor YacG [Pulveribacter suum]AVP58642.1 DNA gyrase inhibitor YacG [Pulveribacter suum]